MVKKNKRNLKALIAKRAELQALKSNVVSIPGAPKISARPQPQPLPREPDIAGKALPEYKPGREIWRTVISTGLVAVLLVAVVVVESRTGFLNGFSDSLYRYLKLNS